MPRRIDTSGRRYHRVCPQVTKEQRAAASVILKEFWERKGGMPDVKIIVLTSQSPELPELPELPVQARILNRSQVTLDQHRLYQKARRYAYFQWKWHEKEPQREYPWLHDQVTWLKLRRKYCREHAANCTELIRRLTTDTTLPPYKGQGERGGRYHVTSSSTEPVTGPTEPTARQASDFNLEAVDAPGLHPLDAVLLATT